MTQKYPIRYVWSVEKHFDFAKSLLIDYGVSEEKSEAVFYGTSGFVKKYSKKPPKSLLSTEIREIADKDANNLREKVEKKLAPLGLSKHRIKKVLYELPDGEELAFILLSYRIHDTEGRTRVRIPLNSSVREHDVIAKQFKKNTTNNTSNE